MKRSKRVLSLGAVGALLVSLMATGLTVAAEPEEPPVYTPPFYNDNYVVVNNYTSADTLPTVWGHEPFTTPALSTDSGGPSPDGSAAALPLNENANSCFYIDNAFTDAPEDAEAVVFWYSLPYTGDAETVPAGYYNPSVHVIAGAKAHNYVGVDFVFADGTSRDGAAGYPQDFTLNTSGYAIIKAEDLTNDANTAETFPISEITRLVLHFDRPGGGVNTANETLYIDDIGYVKDVEAFETAITAKYDVTALQSAVTAAEAEQEAAYTPETWKPFAAALQDAKAVLNDLNGKTVLYKALTGTPDMARVLAALEKKKDELVKVDPGTDPEPEPEDPFAELFGDNYIMINDYTTDDNLPTSWGYPPEPLCSLTTKSGTPSLDGSAAALPFGEEGKNCFNLYGNYGVVTQDAEALVFWYSLPYSGDEDSGSGHYTANINIYADGENGDWVHAWTPATFIRKDSTKVVNTNAGAQEFKLGTSGFVVIDTALLVDDTSGTKFDIADIRSIDLQLSSGWNIEGRTMYIDDIGAVKDKDAFVEMSMELLNCKESADPGTPEEPDNPGQPGDSELADLYDDNYDIINDFTKEEQLPEGWGFDALNSTLSKESGTPSPDGSAAALPLNDNANNSYHIKGDFASAEKGAEGLAFWYSLPYNRTDETGTGYYNVYVNITTKDGKSHNWTPITFIRTGSETVGAAGTQDFTLNTWGYAIIDAKDLIPDGSPEGTAPFDVSDIVNIDFQAAGSAVNVAGKTLYIDDLGVVKDLEAFKEKVRTLINPSYMVQPLTPGEDITLEASFESTFVDAKWNAMEGAYQYYVNLYTVDGDAYTFVKTDSTRQLESTISGLTASTKYAVQVLALDTNEKILSASNLVEFTTLAEDVPEYMSGPLPFDETMTANNVTVNGDNATIHWDWVDGVYSYTVYLYSVEDGKNVYVTKETADFEDGSVTFLGLDVSKKYLAQVVAYDISESIIFAYVPMEFNLTDNNGGTTPKDPVDTGYAMPVSILLLAAGAAAVAVATRKRKA